MDESGVSAALSLFVPGAGQIYNGDYSRGTFWLIVAPATWVLTGGMFGWACHLVAAFTAHRRGEKRFLKLA
jgi:TM2 domain-containing membrane protein YozV